MNTTTERKAEMTNREWATLIASQFEVPADPSVIDALEEAVARGRTLERDQNDEA